MRRIFLTLLLLSMLCGIYALTGFGISNAFDIVPCTLPVELSSFNAVINGHNNVQVTWTTQSQTNLTGFYIYRNSIKEVATAECVSPLFPATNSSTLQTYAFTDIGVDAGLWYYWLESQEYDGSSDFHGPVFVTVSHDGQQGIPDIPQITGIKSVFPNPFNPSTTITIGLTKAADVNMEIYNVKGELVRKLASGRKNEGTHNILWNGLSDSGQACGSGIYILKLKAGSETTQAKLTLLK
ncbi:MAG: T9SS type A sorting domain-containing protein [Candidatus Cloacimonetes bacterium]|nr:T9SS type A sorting domain-containing protein [Candidatus Cloacimonadota bacterium]MDY0171318.1 T9SS type A sorting domain-containing protein [Candidatus Cloacimonadaceae bacterium]